MCAGRRMPRWAAGGGALQTQLTSVGSARPAGEGLQETLSHPDWVLAPPFRDFSSLLKHGAFNCPALRWPYFLLHTCPSTPDPQPVHPSPVQVPSRRGPPWRREGWTKGLGDQLLLPKRGQVPHGAREDELSLDQGYVRSRPRRQ